DKDYAILMSTSAGAWRYLIGDTIKFVNKERSEIIITGRTKHFLSLVGEHLSVDNMNRAIQMASEKFNASIAEFTVAGVPLNGFFGHKWYIGSDDSIDATALKHFIDQSLMELNDDYAVERKSALKDITVDVLPEKIFMEFMAKKGKVGGQHKFPRVLKGSLLEEWNEFIKMNT
ncbi:MAG: GH3 auxin-responsive promoter family protein, partial [Chitinophagaceae bacterium]